MVLEKWFHIVLTKLEKTLRIYVDGKFVEEGAHPRENKVIDGEFYIGWSGNSQWYNGEILKGSR